MPPLKFQSPEGKIITVDSPDGSIPTEQELDQLFQMAGDNQPQPKSQSTFLPGANRVEKLISQRQDSWKSLIDELKYNPNPLQHPIDFLMKNPTTLLKLLGVPWGRGESALASAGLAAQKGEGGDILTEMVKGASGKRQAQLGDIIRTTGFGGKANELISSLTGGAAMAGVGELLTTGKMGLLGKGKTFRQVGSEAGQEIGAMGNAIKGLAKKGIQVSQNAIETIKNIPDKLFRGGLNKVEALRVESQYGSSNGSLVEQVKNKLGEFITKAENTYKNAVNSFKGNEINSQGFFNTIQKGLREKGWIDLQGNPTTRYQSGLDPVVDKLTNLYMDLKSGTINTGKKIVGNIISKEDFSTYRDALGSMLREKPSDILVMKSRNALYESAEKSGMTGIKAARDLEKQAFTVESKFLNRNTGDLKIATETNLNKLGVGKISQKDIAHIEELQKIVKHPIISDATKINKLNKAKDIMKTIKRRGGDVALGAIGLGVIKKITTGRF